MRMNSSDPCTPCDVKLGRSYLQLGMPDAPGTVLKLSRQILPDAVQLLIRLLRQRLDRIGSRTRQA